MIQKNLNPPPPLAKVATLLLLAVLAAPVQAQQLVIPATTGAEACAQGGWSEINSGLFLQTPTQNTLSITVPRLTLLDIRGLTGDSSLTSATVYVAAQKSGVRTALQATNVGTATQSAATTLRNVTFNSLEKSTRYVVILYLTLDSPFVRHCFKTRGEFTNAEQNLFLDGSEWKPNLTQYNRTGCYAVASTRQDIRDCYCNGKRNGTHILAGQTVASQAQRQYLNCPDLDS